MRNSFTVVAASFGALMFACGGGGGSSSGYTWHGLDEATGQNVSITQGPIAQGQSFNGVYRSPQIGDVQILMTGDSMVGAYEYDRGSCHARGRLEGSASGNLLRFNWTEDQRECGHIEPLRGRGYFLYSVETVGDMQRGRIWGHWGYGTDDRGGGPWIGFKIAGRQPTISAEPASGGESSGDNSNGGGSSGGGTSDGGT